MGDWEEHKVRRNPKAQGKVGEGSQQRLRRPADQAPAEGGGDLEERKVRGDLRAKGRGGHINGNNVEPSVTCLFLNS